VHPEGPNPEERVKVTASDRQLLEADGWIVECESPFEIQKMGDHGESLGFAVGEAAEIVINHLRSAGRTVVSSGSGSGGEDQGVVRKWISEKGFGFIVPDAGGEDIFVHQSKIDMEGFRLLEEGQRVKFTVETGRDGRVSADWCKPI